MQIDMIGIFDHPAWCGVQGLAKVPLVRSRGNALVMGVARSFVIGVRAEFADRDLSARANSSTKHAIYSLGSRGPLKLDLGHVGRFQMMKCTMRKLNFMQD